VISSRELRDHDGSPADPRSGDLRHLREQGLIEATRVPGYREHAVRLTKEGRSLLESHRDRDHEHQQTFYAGMAREREREHDLQVHRAYEQAEARLLEHGAHIERVALATS
jgi:DNA-binding MarR family transcriptional regulator